MLHVLVKEGLEDGVLTAEPGVDHGPAVSRPSADLGGSRCLPAFLDDQLRRGLEQPPPRDLDASGWVRPRVGDGTLAY